MIESYQTELAPVRPWNQGEPQINGPEIFGVRRSARTLLPIAATGERPISFCAEGLPAGLEMNSGTGVIEGRAAQEGRFIVLICVSNRQGSCSVEITLIVGDQIALTPPMGWNSWNCWAEHITDEKIRISADRLVESGLAAHGYSYVNIDAGWQGERGGKLNAIQGNENFPDMGGLCDYIHTKGLRAGIYSTPWVKSYCSNGEGFTGGSSGSNSGVQSPLANHIAEKKYIGEITYETEDSRQWAEWGFDYLKYDWITNDVPTTARMANALKASGRDVVYSLSNNAPFEQAQEWAELSNCWRTTGDITDTWESVCHNGFMKESWMPVVGPGHWCDPDMLVVGQLGWGTPRPSRLTPDEQILHVTLWVLLCAPLITGCDLTQLDDFTLRLLCNDEVLAVNQDSAGHPASCVRDVRQHDLNGVLRYHETVYVKPLQDGSLAVGLFNRGSEAVEMHLNFQELGLPGRQDVRNLWSRKKTGSIDDTIRIGVSSHGAQLLKIG